MLSQGASVYASEIAPSQPVLSERPIRVMVVDDSAVVRGLVSRWIDEEPGLKVVARHANGKLAVEDVVRSAPDIVLLDIEMPVMDGLEALPLLLRARPGLRVLMVSTLTQRNAEISFKALALGAIDYVPKPDTNREITIQPDFRREVIEKIKVLGPLSLRRKGADVPSSATAAQLEGGEKSRAFRRRAFSLVPPRVIAIGSSTGGPQALGSLLGALSPSLSRLRGAGGATHAADVHHGARRAVGAGDRARSAGGQGWRGAEARGDLCGAWRSSYDGGAARSRLACVSAAGRR